MPTEGVWRNERHQYWSSFGDVRRGPLPSVTTILDVIDKPQLAAWKVKRAATFAVEHLDTVRTMLEAAPGSEADAASWIAREADRTRDTAGARGTWVHEVCARIALGRPVTALEGENPYVVAFREWWAQVQPATAIVERMGINEEIGYGGTLDLIARIDGRNWLIDLKTSKGVYPGTAGQLAAYAKFDYLGTPNSSIKEPMPVCSKFAVLHLTSWGARFVEYRPTVATWDMFKGAAAIKAWLNGEAKSVMIGDKPND